MPHPTAGREPEVHETFGDYRLEALLGRGGMGEVYQATDLRRGRTVALKLLHRDLATDPQYRERFRREARMATGLSSPHIVPIHDFGEIDGHLFIDMRFLHGHDLGAEIARAPLSPERAVGVVEQVAAALDDAHAAGLAHRDVKPSNIVLAAGAVGDFAYLVDFGVARAVDGGTSLTTTGATVGTLAYMAPEFFTGDDPADHRSDVYALGCTFVEMLTGRPPFAHAAPSAVMYHHLESPAPRPSDRGVPGFDDVVATAMAKDRDRRHRSAGEFAAACRRALEVIRDDDVTTPVARPRSVDGSARGGGPARRRWLLGGLGATIVAGGVVLALVVGPGADRDDGAAPVEQIDPPAGTPVAEQFTAETSLLVYTSPTTTSQIPGYVPAATFRGVCGVLGDVVFDANSADGRSRTWLRFTVRSPQSGGPTVVHVPAAFLPPGSPRTSDGTVAGAVRSCDGGDLLPL